MRRRGAGEWRPGSGGDPGDVRAVASLIGRHPRNVVAAKFQSRTLGNARPRLGLVPHPLDTRAVKGHVAPIDTAVANADDNTRTVQSLARPDLRHPTPR